MQTHCRYTFCGEERLIPHKKKYVNSQSSTQDTCDLRYSQIAHKSQFWLIRVFSFWDLMTTTFRFIVGDQCLKSFFFYTINDIPLYRTQTSQTFKIKLNPNFFFQKINVIFTKFSYLKYLHQFCCCVLFFIFWFEQQSDMPSLGYNEVTTAVHTHGVFQPTVDMTIY